ncbi:Ribosomal small subunit pseudouridine synthase A [Lacticaseibacillus paracasei]|uniref:pseudouridine synthase n=1 Tax=Lacticaseibacillus paracasei TaxID=1597 RepID=UPI000F43AEB7|nr:RNA pseudouridine synthase [Lacticaseibacillus paracasei]MBM6409344.1 pseudouridine synthase [Lacticaseibacillus paracasei]RND66385.1 Ribosomal small subunit pseudouridine synthase A [Lacticaseibacillus paracasei]RND71545.1 Ribosomal small subunit pseudouridine synthase A [Lacticaseibacillus paracasei]
MRLDKYLSHLQFGSRKEVKALIRDKRVRVAGDLITDPGYNVLPGIAVEVNDAQADGPLEVDYLMNKPAGVITATEDPTQSTVLDLIRPHDYRPGLYPVGRLDKDTTGLLLLTTDGNLGHALLSPNRHIAKTYAATLAKTLTVDMKQRLETGIDLKDFTTAPAQVVVLPDTDGKRIQITITEGKFHQVKRMLLAVDNEVTALTRIAMGPLSLPADLAAGEYQALTDDERTDLDNITR